MTLTVSQDYDIRIAALDENHLQWLVSRRYAGWVVIVDEETEKHCWPRLEPLLRPAGTPITLVRVPAGERHKTLSTCENIWQEMFRAGVGRRWCCLNLGGGVIGDMGGFAAATFKRGIDFVQLPTTLLSQVDASVGGKLGIDYHEVKNSIGVFANPQAVWIDPAFLETLPPRELRSGYAEVIKHALIADAGQWEELRGITELSTVSWEALIAHSVNIKREIVEEDPHERGLRKALNFGHTIGHAVESYLLAGDHRLLHGEAVAVGMITESFISHRQQSLSGEDLEAITGYCLEVYGHQPLPEAGFPAMLDLMRQDKKNEGTEINFTLLDRPGQAVVNATATPEIILESLRYYNSLG
ncbi:3-dehydroquinate synthase [Lewinella marina]|uniref:3-dehydroquinate synthase n=1 Tax=Neolewinella marina TaxID=438751 RepID=A0A2G0CF23_9BACT|nr:3-dehydroquinate synthase [Neolewinella marina]NJB85750.1 3-dehydroquinate synthase [Neolewinella marina]PHK98576.1 3-dehydroquinate synthase [Neolewinella marina]